MFQSHLENDTGTRDPPVSRPIVPPVGTEPVYEGGWSEGREGHRQWFVSRHSWRRYYRSYKCERHRLSKTNEEREKKQQEQQQQRIKVSTEGTRGES